MMLYQRVEAPWVRIVGAFYITGGIRAFCSHVSRRDPFNLALMSFPTSPLRKTDSRVRQRASSSSSSSSQHSHHMLEHAAAIPSMPITVRLFTPRIRLRSSSGCHADNRRFDYLLVPTPVNYSRANVGTPFGSGRAAITAENEVTGGMARPLVPFFSRHPLFRRSAICLREGTRPKHSLSLPACQSVSLLRHAAINHPQPLMNGREDEEREKRRTFIPRCFASLYSGILS